MNWNYRAFVESCRRDRELLFAEWRRWKGVRVTPVPADIIDEIIGEIVGFDILVCKLPRNKLGETDFDKRLIRINEDPSKGLRYKNVDIPGLIVSTKGHELGHIRSGHEKLARMVAPQAVLHRAIIDELDRQADTYSQLFLMPEDQVLASAEVELLHQRGNAMDASDIWRDVIYPLAIHFRVTPTNMKSRLKCLRLIRVERSQENLLAG